MIEQLPPPYFMQQGRAAQAEPATYEDLLLRTKANQQYLAQAATIIYAQSGQPVILPDGSAVSPALSFSRDPFTGRYLVAVGNVGESVNKTLVYDWDSSRFKLATAYKFYMGASGPISGDVGADYVAILDSLNGGVRAELRNTSAGGVAYAQWAALNNVNNDIVIRFNGSAHASVGLTGTTAAGMLALANNAGAGTGSASLIVVNAINDAGSVIIFGTRNLDRGRILENGVWCINTNAAVAGESLRVNGGIRCDGVLSIANGNVAAPAFYFATPGIGLYTPSSKIIGFSDGTTGVIAMQLLAGSENLALASTGSFSWSSTGDAAGVAADTKLTRDAAASIAMSGLGNGQKITFFTLTELTTIAAAATTDTAIQIPLDAVVFSVTTRVTVAIPTAATYTVTGTTSGTQFDVAGGIATAVNTTDVGTRNCPFKNGAAQTIRFTPNVVPGTNAGRVRVTLHYYKPTPATS